MLVTTIFFYFAARLLCNWSVLKTLQLCLVFGLIELAFPSPYLIVSLASGKVVKVPGTAVFMTSTAGRTPVALLHSLKQYQAIHQRVILMTLTTEDEPWVPPSRRVEVEDLGDNFWRITGHSGFMQTPNVPRLLRQCLNHDLEFDPEKSTFFLGREIIIPSARPGMACWREHLFSLASKLAQQPATYCSDSCGAGD